MKSGVPLEGKDEEHSTELLKPSAATCDENPWPPVNK